MLVLVHVLQQVNSKTTTKQENHWEEEQGIKSLKQPSIIASESIWQSKLF